MTEDNYLAIKFGNDKKYGIIVPFGDDFDSKKDVEEFKRRENMGKITILYNGPSLESAKKSIFGLKKVSELVEMVEQEGII